MADSTGIRPNWTIIAFGVFAMVVGALPLLTVLGILPHAQHASDPAPSWMGWLIGLMFGGAGISIIMQGVMGADARGALPESAPRSLRMAQELLGVFIVCALASLFTWIAFGPGVRHFSVSAGGFSTPTSGDMMGRIAFGFGAMLVWCFAAYAVTTTLRRWRQ
jgi:hypothetical protein